MMAPQVAQEGESPMSYMDFMASETWYTRLYLQKQFLVGRGR
jgi:hypothetical protein